MTYRHFDMNNDHSQIIYYPRKEWDDATNPFGKLDFNSSFTQKLLEIKESFSVISEDTYLHADLKSSSSKNEDRFLTEYERNLMEMSVSFNGEEYKRLVDKLSYELEEALDLYQYESDSDSKAEDLIIDIEHRYSFQILGSVVQTVYTRHYNRPFYLIEICNALMRYDLEEVDPWATVMLTGLINHPDEAVLEVVVQLIDNWRNKSLIPTLSTINVSSDWLRDYIDEVVRGLECE